MTMFLEEAPEAMRTAGVTTLLIDQVLALGSSIAEHLKVPFITVCNAAPMDSDPESLFVFELGSCFVLGGSYQNPHRLAPSTRVDPAS